MKKSFVVVLFICLTVFSFAQSFNLSVGLGLSLQSRKSYPFGEENLKPLWTLNSQFSRDYRIWRSIFFRPEVSYYQQGYFCPIHLYYETFHYIGLDNFLLFRSFTSPVYFGVGGYGSWLVSASTTIGDDVVSQNLNAYKTWDYGVIPVLGFVLDFDFISYYTELRYRFGFNDITKVDNDYIKNQGLEINFGISLRIH